MADLNIRKLIHDAAEKGDPFAQFELAIAFDYGYDGEQDFEKASAWYLKAASQGHDAADGNLLLQHIFGQASLVEPQEVFRRLKTRAESGDREAQNISVFATSMATGRNRIMLKPRYGSVGLQKVAWPRHNSISVVCIRAQKTCISCFVS